MLLLLLLSKCLTEFSSSFLQSNFPVWTAEKMLFSFKKKVKKGSSDSPVILLICFQVDAATQCDPDEIIVLSDSE